jgi:hypothetical protein
MGAITLKFCRICNVFPLSILIVFMQNKYHDVMPLLPSSHILPFSYRLSPEKNKWADFQGFKLKRVVYYIIYITKVS